MKQLGVALFFAAIVLGLCAQANALQTTYAARNISLDFVVTPSPTPIAYVPSAPAASSAPVATAFLAPSNPLDGLLAYEALRTSDMVAQSVPQGNAKVQFNVKADPKFANFHLVLHTTSFNAGYGSNTYTCAYEVFAAYSSAWNVTDFVYGTNTSSGTAGFNGYPTYNYPTTSQLSWLAQGVTTTFKPFANAGGPGEQTFNGAAGASRQICIDLTLNVPASVAAGAYQTTIQYNLIVSI